MENESNLVTEKIQIIQYAIEKLGFPLLVCAFLGWLLWHKIEQINYRLERVIRNERAIMQKLGIPVIVAKDDWEK